MKNSLRSLLATALLGVSAFVSPLLSKTTDEVVQLRVEFDRSTLPAHTKEKAVVKVCFDGLRLPRAEARPPVNLALVIDRSGSMSGDKITKAKEAALEALSRLAADDILTVIAYDSEVQTLVPARRVGSGHEIAAAIRAIRAEGGTALFGGVSQGASELRKNLEDSRYVHRVILLSDGQANVGPSSPDDLARLGTALMKEGISVSTIGLGLGFNEDLMTRLAQRSDGNTYFVESSDVLPRVFASELGDVLNVIARRVVVEINFPDSVRPLGFVGRDGVINGRKAELSLNQLYGGQEKFALIEVEVASQNADHEMDLASATLRYENVLTQKAVSQRASGRVRFSKDREAVVSSANLKVQTDYAANVVALSKDRAVELVDANNRDEAARQLRAKAVELKATADSYGNAQLAAFAVEQARDADKIEREGLSNAARKSYRAASAATKNQQSSSGDKQ